MSSEVKVPAVGESISSGLLAAWHKSDGDAVETGDILFTLETDKVSSEVTATDSGTLQITVAEGEEVKIGQVVATLTAGAAAKSAAKPDKPAAAVTEPKTTAAAENSAPTPEGETPKDRQGPSTLSEVVAPTGGDDEQSPAPTASTQSSPAPEAGDPGDPARSSRRKLSPLRRKIATQLVAAQQTAAILTTFNECDMTAVMELRKRMQDDFVKRHGIKLGFMSFFIKATVDALKAVPGVNARMDGDHLVTNHYYDVGVAVGTDKGLMVPVVRDCDLKSFAQIEQSLADFAGKAREGKVSLDDLQGGVFTISNGGIYGSLMSTPILNPPQSGILGMHTIQERPVARNGQVVIRPMMYLALSYDHRVIDGKEAVTFLVRVKDCIENPMRLLLGA